MAQIFDYLAQTYQSLSPPLNASRCVNFFPEIQTQDSKSKTPIPVWGCPGISPFAICGDGPVKAFNVMNDQLYAVSGQSLWRVNANGTTVNLGDWKLQNRISIDNNGIEIVAVDGQTGWQYSVAGGCSRIVDPNFYPANTVTFFDGYFCFDRVGTKQFFLSPVFGVTPFDGALFASKEATSDLLLATANAHEQLYLFGERRVEVWYDAGNAPPTFPFQRSDGAIIQRGTLAPYSIVQEDNTLFFMGEDLIYYRLDGFKPERISDFGAETQWAKYREPHNILSFIYTWNGHKLLNLTFLSANKTWTLDLSTRRWHERESWLGSSEDDSIGKWRIGSAINWYGRTLVGDTQSGVIGQLNQNVYTEFGDTMRGLLIGPPIAKDRRRMFMKRFEIDVETATTTATGSSSFVSTYCATPIDIQTPTAMETSGALQNTPATFSTFVFSDWVRLVDDAELRGFWFSNQADDDAPGNGGVQIGVFNDDTTPAGQQIIVRAWDASDDPIVDAAYGLTTWADWIWLGISMDTATNQLQVYVNAGLGDQVLTPSYLIWSSTNPMANKTGEPWHIRPAAAAGFDFLTPDTPNGVLNLNVLAPP